MEGAGDREIETKTEATQDLFHNDKDSTIVFYCAGCSSIFGDSLSWLCVNEGIQSIVLKRVTRKIKECEELSLSTTGFDKGSAFVGLKCTSCSEIVGRMYKSTAPHLDDQRNIYNLYAPKIESYTVGTADQEAIDILKNDDSKLTYCFKQIRRLQQVVVDLNRRLGDVEHSDSALRVKADDCSEDNEHYTTHNSSSGSKNTSSGSGKTHVSAKRKNSEIVHNSSGRKNKRKKDTCD